MCPTLGLWCPLKKCLFCFRCYYFPVLRWEARSRTMADGEPEPHKGAIQVHGRTISATTKVTSRWRTLGENDLNFPVIRYLISIFRATAKGIFQFLKKAIFLKSFVCPLVSKILHKLMFQTPLLPFVYVQNNSRNFCHQNFPDSCITGKFSHNLETLWRIFLTIH